MNVPGSGGHRGGRGRSPMRGAYQSYWTGARRSVSNAPVNVAGGGGCRGGRPGLAVI